jgi:chemosensory pili system protein ChpA (sensor histidine kinase/response regulator)
MHKLPGPWGRSLEPNKILVVAEPHIARLTQVNHKLAGIDVRKAHDAPQALERIAEERPSFIFVDVFGPGMEGFEVLKRLQADPDMRSIRVVPITSHDPRDWLDKIAVDQNLKFR